MGARDRGGKANENPAADQPSRAQSGVGTSREICGGLASRLTHVSRVREKV
jgi:hypothetical protein